MARSQLRHVLQSMFLGGLTVGIVNFVAQIAFARVLGISIIADYAKIVVAINIVIFLTSFGFNHAVIGRGFTLQRAQNCLALTLLQTGFISLIFVLSFGLVAIVYPTEFSRLWAPGLLLIVGVLALPPAHAFTAEIECNLEYGKLALFRLSAVVGANGLAALLCYFHPNIFVLPFRDGMNGVLYLLVSYLFLKQPLSVRLNRKIAWDLINYTKKVWLVNMSSEGGKRIDYALIGIMLNSLSFGIYFQIRNLAEGVLSFVLYPVQSALFSYMRKERDSFDFRRVARRLFPPAILVGLVGVLILHFFGSEIVTTLLGEEWRAGAVVLVPFTIYATIAIYFEILVSMSKALDNMAPIILARIVNIAAIAVLVPVLAAYFGIRGAAWGAAIAATFMLATGIILFSNKIRLPTVRPSP